MTTRPVPHGPIWVPLLFVPLTVVTLLAGLGDVVVTFIAYHLLICVGIPFFELRLTRRHPNETFRTFTALDRFGDRRSLAIGATIGAVTAIVTVLGYALARATFLDGIEVEVAAARLAVWGVRPGFAVPLFVYMVVANPLAEEIYWRGWLQTHLHQWTNRPLALLVGTISFAGFHYYTIGQLLGSWGFAVVGVLFVFAGGLTFAWLRARSGSVWPGVLAHMGASVGYMTVYLTWAV